MPRKKLPPNVEQSKSRLDEMRAMRTVLARKIDDDRTSARDLSPLVRRLQELSEAIESLEIRESEAAKDDQARSSTEDTPWELMDI